AAGGRCEDALARGGHVDTVTDGGPRRHAVARVGGADGEDVRIVRAGVEDARVAAGHGDDATVAHKALSRALYGRAIRGREAQVGDLGAVAGGPLQGGGHRAGTRSSIGRGDAQRHDLAAVAHAGDAGHVIGGRRGDAGDHGAVPVYVAGVAI